MNKQQVYDILKKYNFINKDMTLTALAKIKKCFHPEVTWVEYMKDIFLAYYISGKLPDEGIFIEELNFQLGGSATFDLKAAENLKVTYSAVKKEAIK